MLSSRRPRNHSCWNQAGSSAIDSLRSTGHFIEMHRFVRYFCICFVGKVKRSVLSLEKHRNKHYVSNVLPCATLFYSWPIIIHFCDILREFHMSCLTSTQVDRRRKHTTQRPLQLWLCTVCQRREGWKDVKRSSCHFWMLPFRHWKYIMDFLIFSMIFGNLFRMKQKSMLHVLCAPTAADRLQWWNQNCPTSTNSSKGRWEIVISWQRRSWNHAPSVHMCRCVHVIHADVDESEICSFVKWFWNNPPVRFHCLDLRRTMP